LWFFLFGALVPIPFYFLARRHPLSFWRYINIPVFLAGTGSMPPASGLNYSSWFLVGFIFQWFMRRFHFRWWMRYNYILSGGLDAGVAVGLIIVFFTVQFPANGTIGRNTIQTWWGNTVRFVAYNCCILLIHLIHLIQTGLDEDSRRSGYTFQTSRSWRDFRTDVVVVDLPYFPL